MRNYRFLRDFKIESDLFVEQSIGHSLHDLFFPSAQLFVNGNCMTDFVIFTSRLSVSLQRKIYNLDEFLDFDRFGQKIESSVLDCLDRHFDITVSRYEHKGKRIAEQPQLSLQFKTAHAGHANVANNATGLMGIIFA